MEGLYEAAQVSRQSFHQWKQPSLSEMERPSQQEVVEIARLVRKKYLPGAGARMIYDYIRQRLPEYSMRLKRCGKHIFEAFCLEGGMRVTARKFIPKTTEHGEFSFPNLIEGVVVWDIDCIWVCDITYVFGTDGKLIAYATSLIDIYSRRLLGLSFSQTMHAAVTSSEVIRQALKVRKKAKFDQLIFHSDGGKQFIEKNFLNTIRKAEILSSMARNCLENGFSEAFNDTLKNHMAHDFNFNSFLQFKKNENFFKDCYNFNKPHSALNKMTPVAYEQHILNLNICQRTKLTIKVIEPKLWTLKASFLSLIE